jgi:hypothetical protein
MFNKIILAAIAAGLWANVAVTLVRPAHADSDSDISSIETLVRSIEGDLGRIEHGNCQNSKIC